MTEHRTMPDPATVLAEIAGSSVDLVNHLCDAVLRGDDWTPETARPFLELSREFREQLRRTEKAVAEVLPAGDSLRIETMEKEVRMIPDPRITWPK